MADFKIYGRIVDIYSPRQGETNGKPWQLQDLVIEEQQNEYTNRVLITLNNYRTNQDECDLIGKSLSDGVMVTASCRSAAESGSGTARAATPPMCKYGKWRRATPAADARRTTESRVWCR